MRNLFCLTALLSCALTLPCSAAIYKWVDENGVTHYSESPPPSQKAQEIKPVPSSSPAASKEKTAEQLELEFRQRRLEAAESDKKKAADANKVKHDAALRGEDCAAAHADLIHLQESVPFYSINARGEREYMPDAERPAEIARLKAFIEKSCPR